MGRRLARLVLLPAAVLATYAPARAYEDVVSYGGFSLDLTGYLEGRFIVSSDTRSWDDAGLGKVRYGGTAGGDPRVLPRVESKVVLEPKFGFDWSGTVVVSGNDQQRTALDVTEAFLQYKPAPTQGLGFKAKLGAFFPPISQENTGVAWTSPYTITSSAINSWVGEELKTIGGEVTFFHRGEDMEVGLTGAVYGANDPAGTLLAWRGWSLNDRQTGFFDHLQLAPIPIISPTGKLSTQAREEEPFHEIDGRLGYYVQLTAEDVAYGKVSVLWYDNKADDHGFVNGQWAWRTKFLSIGYSTDLPGDVDLIAQYMTGSTTVITIPKPVGPIVDTNYSSAYALLSKEWGKNRLSMRAEYFETDDRDKFADNNNEHGMALTLAYIFRPAVDQRLTIEVLGVSSRRPERAALGLPTHAFETQTQASYRLFF